MEHRVPTIISGSAWTQRWALRPRFHFLPKFAPVAFMLLLFTPLSTHSFVFRRLFDDVHKGKFHREQRFLLYIKVTDWRPSSTMSPLLTQGQHISSTECISQRANETYIYPKLGSYIVVSLDVFATLNKTLDANLLSQYKSLEKKKYIALIEKIDTSRDCFPCQYVSLRFVFQDTIPLSSEKNGIRKDMITSILPNVSPHGSRDSLVPSRPLPWDRCYHSSFVSAEVYCGGFERSQTMHRIALDRRQLSHNRHNTLSDLRQSEQGKNLLEPSTHFYPTNPDELPAREAFAYERLKCPIVIKSSYHLSTVGTLPNPREFFEDAMTLIRVKQTMLSSPSPNKPLKFRQSMVTLARKSQETVVSPQDDSVPILRAIKSFDDLQCERNKPSFVPLTQAIAPLASSVTVSGRIPPQSGDQEFKPCIRSESRRSWDSGTSMPYHGAASFRQELLFPKRKNRIYLWAKALCCCVGSESNLD